MPVQNYDNHTRYYAPHHYVYYPVVLTATIVTGTFIFTRHNERLVWLTFTGIFMLLTWLSVMLRQHYALTSQNRSIRVELRLRFYIITQERLENYEDKLSIGQIVALRFAPDDELVSLLNKAIEQNLTPKQIKKSIVNWLPDHLRV